MVHDDVPGAPEGHWTRRVDWAGLSVFVLALAIGVSVVVVVAVEVIHAGERQGDPNVLVPAITTVVGAMVGAVSTYIGVFRREVEARHRRDDEL